MKKALLVIDAQKEYGPEGALPVERLDQTIKNIQELIDFCRQSPDLEIIHIRHVSRIAGDSSFDDGTIGVDFLPGLEPSPEEKVITKHFPGAFSNPELERYLSQLKIEELWICGFTSFLCCDTTAREAFQKGYSVKYIDDAISEFPLEAVDADTLHYVVASIQDAMFSEICNTNDLLMK